MTGLTFSQPLAALSAAAGLVPLAVALLRLRAARRVRRGLGLPEPRRRAQLVRPVALVALFALLGLAASRPTLRSHREQALRTDVQVVVALDGSRSMLASSSPGGRERWQRAAAFARRLPAALPGVPVGLASFTNRLVPYLFPTTDRRAYDLVLGQAYGIERPRPAHTVDRWVTDLGVLREAATLAFYSPGVRRRVLVVLSDVETQPLDERALLHRLERSGTTPVVVRFWQAGERIFAPRSASYRATEPDALARLRAAGWPAFSERQLGPALGRIRAAVGTGPLVRVGAGAGRVQLAPWLALAALAPLSLLLLQGGHLGSLRRRLPRARAGGAARLGPASASRP